MIGKLVTLSGIDGSGKSSQIESIQDYYNSQNISFVYLWTRGGNTPGIEMFKTLGRKVAGKKLPPSGHSSQRDKMFRKKWIAKLWLTFAMADLIRIYAINIRWQLWTGKMVVCDRYLWDTFIDFKIMFPGISFEKWMLWKALIWFTPKPYVEYLLMIPVDISEKRCLQKYEPFPDTPERRSRRYKLYQEILSSNEWTVIDATKNSEAVFSEIQ